MAGDPRRALIAGVGQATWRGGDAPDPITMCAEVINSASLDSGAGGALLGRATALGVVDIASRRWKDPASLIAKQLGIEPKLTLRTELGGDGPLRLIAELSERIASGELDCAIVCGAEALATLAKAMASGNEPDWPAEDSATPSVLLGSDRAPATDAENAANMIAPIIVYPLFEYALWADQGGTIEQHRARLGALWERFASVAESNPYAWTAKPPSASEIATPSPQNRLVTLPYTKLLNSNIQTDQAAAVILCSQEVALELGVARDRWVFPLAFGHAEEHWFVSSRERLDRSPAMGLAARGALSAAGIDADDAAHLDIYSCFPSAVQMACHELGIDAWNDSRPLTVTGGLSFAGGPGNNYATHAVCSLVERLREDPDSSGLSTAVGWYMTKHAAAVFAAGEPERPLASLDARAEAGALPSRRVAEGRSGSATAEAATVVYDREGQPTVATLTGIFEDGSRGVAQSTEAGLLGELAGEPITGRPMTFTGDGTAALA